MFSKTKEKIVEIGEGLFLKNKNKSGWILLGQWIFEHIYYENGKCFLIKIPDRKATILIQASGEQGA